MHHAFYSPCLMLVWTNHRRATVQRGWTSHILRPEGFGCSQGCPCCPTQLCEADWACRYGLTDIQEYYANTGALKQAATDAQGAPSAMHTASCQHEPACLSQ